MKMFQLPFWNIHSFYNDIHLMSILFLESLSSNSYLIKNLFLWRFFKNPIIKCQSSRIISKVFIYYYWNIYNVGVFHI